MKSKSMRFRWLSSLKKWVVNNLCCVVRKKNSKRQRCVDLKSDVGDKYGDVTTFSEIDLSTITSADQPSPSHAEWARLKKILLAPLGHFHYWNLKTIVVSRTFVRLYRMVDSRNSIHQVTNVMMVGRYGSLAVRVKFDVFTSGENIAVHSRSMEYKDALRTGIGSTLHRLVHMGRDSLEREIAKLKLQDLHKVTPLGVGGFGRVILVQENNNSSETYALKILSKQHIVAIGQQTQVLNEKNIMAELRSDFIVRLYKTFKDEEYLYLLMEPCLGGELFTLLYEEKNLSHTAAKFYTACIVEAFRFMHSKGIIHRDLKPENVLLDTKGYAKLIDFGMAKKVKQGKMSRTLCGTPEYMAPEIILRKGHNTAADIWSLGVLVFDMLSGSSLFADKDDNDMQTCNNILKGINDVVFPNEIRRIAEDFIRRLCRKNPAKRLTAQEIPKHGWFNEFHWEGIRSRTMEPPFIPKVESSVDTSNFDLEGLPKEADYPRTVDVTSWDPDF